MQESLSTLTYNPDVLSFKTRYAFLLLVTFLLFVNACAPSTTDSGQARESALGNLASEIPPGFAIVDGSRPLSFPKDLGAHEDFRTEWWYYTGNLQTIDGRHFGFELTIFRVGLVPPTVTLPTDSKWYSHSVYFAHFALSDIAGNKFYAFDRYSRPGPGLAGAESDPYHIWLEDWNITQQDTGVYRLQASQEAVSIDLTMTDEMGIVLQGKNGYSRKGESPTIASYYYSQPRLRAEGSIEINRNTYHVSGLAWNDHEFSSSVLDADQIGWDWFSLQFEDGQALMLFQLRERGGGVSASSGGTFIAADGMPHAIEKSSFDIKVLKQWESSHTRGIYPAQWQIRLTEPDCLLDVKPWMADQEIHFPSVTYWEGAVHFDGMCAGKAAGGNGYIELTGYIGNLPMP